MPTADAHPPDKPESPPGVLSITDEEWIAASQACCGLDPVEPDDNPPTAAPPPGTP